MTDRLDDLLHQAGRRYATATPARGARPDDLARRSRTRRVTQRAVAGGVLAAILLTGVTALARPFEGASDGVHVQFGGGPHPVPATAAPQPGTPAPSTSAPQPTTTARPTTTTSWSWPDPPPDVSDIRTHNWRAQLFAPDSCPNWGDDPTPITVVPDDAVPTEPGRRWVKLVDVQHGDLTGDGWEEALVVLECGGGAHAPHYGWVYRESIASDVQRLVAVELPAPIRQELRDRYGIVSVTPRRYALRNGEILFEGAGHRADDPNCCPGYPEVVVRLGLQGDVLTGTVDRVEPLPAHLGGPGA